MAVLATIILVLASGLLAYIVWGKSLRGPVDIQIPEEIGLPALIDSFAGITWGRIIEGNSVQIIQDSAFFDVLLADMATARHHIHLETFLWRDGAVSDRVAAALEQASRRGVQVRVLVDQRGSKRTDAQVWANLRRAGCDFRVFHR